MIAALRPRRLAPFPEAAEEDELERTDELGRGTGPGREGGARRARVGDIESEEGERF